MEHPTQTKVFEWGMIALLAVLFLFLLRFTPGINPVSAGIAFTLLVVYHFCTSHLWKGDLFHSNRSTALHLAIYLFLSTLVIWTTSTNEEESVFWVVFLLPIVAAAFRGGLLATSITASSASIIYFLLMPMNVPVEELLADELPEFLVLIVVFFFVGFLVQSLSQAMRQQLLIQKKLNQSLLDHQKSLQDSLEQLAAAEERLHRQDRLAALGEMAAGVAHEIRNPLGIVSSAAQLLGNKISDPDGEAGELLQVVREETARLNGLITDFLTFGRETVPRLQLCNIQQLISKTAERFKGMAGKKDLRLQVIEGPSDITAMLDPDLIEQVLLNLFLNAVDATPAGGEITVNWGVENNNIFMEVADNGVGIPEDIRKKIFNPFFTTKERGTGLGLANAFKFVQAHDGVLDFRSRCGEGTTFRISLPKEVNPDAPYFGG
jgi:two-component system, NtrC family, sensor histidine kinase HydH